MASVMSNFTRCFFQIGLRTLWDGRCYWAAAVPGENPELVDFSNEHQKKYPEGFVTEAEAFCCFIREWQLYKASQKGKPK